MLLKTCLCFSLILYVSCQRRNQGFGGRRDSQQDGWDRQVTSSLKFSELEINMMRRFLETSADKSIAFSPLSMRSVLTMLLEGAEGKTKDELSKIVGDSSSVKSILTSPLKSGISMGNAFYLSNTQDISESFKNALTSGYKAEFQYADFSKPAKAAYNINEWVRRITNKNIDMVVDNMSPDTAFLMANAIHLVAKWRDPFESIETKDGVFYEFGPTSENNNLSPKLAPIMRQINDYKIGHVKSLEARVLEMPFKTPENHAMYVVLPDKPDGLKNVVGNLTAESLGEITSSLAFAHQVTLWMPKFTGSVQRKLKNLLPNDMQDLFSNNADFSKIADSTNVKINEITHKAILKVDEEGAVGSAVTIAEAINLSYTPPTIFNVSHPFMYFIAESSDRDFSYNSPKNLEIYFMGFVGKLDQSKSVPVEWGDLPAQEVYVKPGGSRRRPGRP
jgi:serine protease inhibitor